MLGNPRSSRGRTQDFRTRSWMAARETSWPVGLMRVLVIPALLLGMLAGCASGPLDVAHERRARESAQSHSRASPASHQAGRAERTRSAGASRAAGIDADVLVTSTGPQPGHSGSGEPGPRREKRRALTPVEVRNLRTITGVSASAVLGIGTAAVAGRTVTVGAVNPATFRAFAPPGTASADRVWEAVAAGQVVAAHGTATRLNLPLGGTIAVGDPGSQRAGAGSPSPLRIGAFATTVPSLNLVVNRQTGARLGIEPATAMILSAARRSPEQVAAAVHRRAGTDVRAQVLARRPSQAGTRPSPGTRSGQARTALGSFSYRYYPDGRIQPDPAWVENNIRTRTVPILGEVTCHRLMFPQLSAALREVVRRGFAGSINPRQYGGCYVPRFVGRDPDNPVSPHTWGIAIDLNVAGNQRGTEGDIDRRVVSIFEKWGFEWGGSWDWTDPMHFELEALLRGQEQPHK